jgi:thymidylate synthase (FAD)
MIEVMDPLGDGISKLQLVSYSGSDLDVVNCARVSYAKESEILTEQDSKLIKYLIKNNHGSPFEHTFLKFFVKAPIFVLREWHRHRAGWSYNEWSMRYLRMNETVPLEFYKPVNWRYQSKSNKQASEGEFKDTALDKLYTEQNEKAAETYNRLIESGVAREIARGVLPVCTYTAMFASCNLRSLMHFLSLRNSTAAQYEIRKYAECMSSIAERAFPDSFKHWNSED